MKIPEDIYDRVLELVTMLVNASESGDNRSYWEHYNDLKAFCKTTSEANAEARTLDDLDLRRDISEFLLKVSAA